MVKAKTTGDAGEEPKVAATPKKVDPERQSRWQAFLAKVEAQNPRQFAIDKENGEHDTIPDSFI